MINMLRALIDKNQQHSITDGQGKKRDENSKKESKLNARDQKHCNRNEECLSWHISRLAMTEERLSEFGDISIETSKTKEQRG